ncbi:aspartate-semialdehyde dehydrogenase [Planoprotostelium fungivorum]|uniref:Aspartate-semialdehyde dehydrogenase n=1 Tax=Planoprotostelium fungivorum TaxID=1890364 RepID=A0A2P6MUP0_9EUKA|nr:aspartate-semialdehyde dehydrogenase [Planoprotostelium fungivorum]
MSQSRLRVGILGATGTVGQRFIVLLQNHPQFEITHLGASERSAGQTYKKIVRWKLSQSMPEDIGGLTVTLCDPAHFEGCSLVFSALDSSVAGPVEDAFARAGMAVFSNAKDHRMDSDVPILIPFCNPDHLDIISHQQKSRGLTGNGYIITNANCASTGLVVALKPLQDAFGIDKVIVFTMQAVSGAGYPGVPSLDIYDNVVPYISGEEDKLHVEPRKILGRVEGGDTFVDYDVTLSAMCNRVPVIDGHTECVSIKLNKTATLEEVQKALKEFKPKLPALPSMPPVSLQLFEESDRPQPRLDRDLGRGYTVAVGGVRKCNVLDFKFTLLSHNCVIGAAGGSILNAELALVRGYLK